MKKIIVCMLLAIMILNVTACETKTETVPTETTLAETTFAETTLAETTLAETTLAETTTKAVEDPLKKEIVSVLTSEKWKSYDDSTSENLKEIEFFEDNTCKIAATTYTWEEPKADASGTYYIDILDNGTRAYLIKIKKEKTDIWEIQQIFTLNDIGFIDRDYVRLSDYDAFSNEPKYKKAQEDLKDYLESGYIYVPELKKSLNRNDALQYLYQKFQALGDYKDSKEILERFIVLPEKHITITEVTKDAMGNISKNDFTPFSFESNGKINTILEENYYYKFSEFYSPYSPMLFIGLSYRPVYFEYTENGQIQTIWQGSKNNNGNYVEAVLTPTYDAKGNIIKFNVKNNTEEFTNILTYDASGRLSEIKDHAVYNYGLRPDVTITYSYDKKTNTTEKNMEFLYYGNSRVITYFYDSDNILTKTDEKRKSSFDGKTEEYITEYKTVKDDKGRPVSVTIVSDYDKNDGVVSRTWEMTYTDFYVYEEK